MKQKLSVIEKRRDTILDILQKTSMVRIDDLSKLLSVSALTIRRDLDELKKQNKLERFFGGAYIAQYDNALEFTAKKAANDSYKKAIAAYAASLVEENDIIFLNTSVTSLLMIPHIMKRVTILTNNANALNVEIPPWVTVLLTGGELQGVKRAMTGEFAINNLERVTATKSFLGCSGFSLNSGMTTALMNEVAVNKLMLNRVTGKTYILADNSKIGEESNFVSCPSSQIKNIITDEKVPLKQIHDMKNAGINVMVVDIDGNIIK